MLERARALITMRTPLRDVPRDWLVAVEPKLARGGILKECWIWTAGLDNQGHPTYWVRDPITGKTRSSRVARFVAKMFWPDLKRYHEVLHGCGNVTCLNPSHFRISRAHWTQEIRGPSQELEDEAGSPVTGVHTRGKPKPLDRGNAQ